VSGNLTAAYAETGAEQRTSGQSGTVDATSLPTLTPGDAAYLEGTQKVAATPTPAGDSVTGLAVDGKVIDGERTVGVSRLSFDVGSNSTEARYHNYVRAV
jgi:hypothetical protein